ncbi:PREDICTED: transcription factor Adf-1-like isoform X2 [Bactrocera latifrons]|uniref:Transcription factor Adf-1 n=2 Tax=Bactrocera latifrons TaxID=174628 RepID=A0A0K8UFR4_BACLA|nr:PREDICTED: transcription factor Adf-1-like isoform X2 [Bactrocera latifrons]
MNSCVVKTEISGQHCKLFEIPLTMDVDDMLISEVRNRPFLYDLSHPDYKSLKKKDYAWRHIAVCLKLSEMQCKKRWKSLRDSYKRCKRMKTDGSSESTRKKWRYLEAMTFLDNVKDHKRIRSSSEEMDPISVDEALDLLDEDSTNLSFSEPENSPTRSADAHGQRASASSPSRPSDARGQRASESSPCRPSDARGQLNSQKKESDKFKQFLDLASASISNTCATFVEKAHKQDSTALHFSSLAAKITEAGLSPKVVNQIEAKVSAIVFGEIDKFYSGHLK